MTGEGVEAVKVVVVEVVQAVQAVAILTPFCVFKSNDKCSFPFFFNLKLIRFWECVSGDEGRAVGREGAGEVAVVVVVAVHVALNLNNNNFYTHIYKLQHISFGFFFIRLKFCSPCRAGEREGTLLASISHDYLK